MRAFAFALALMAACSSEPPPVSSGTGGAVCSFTATGTMSNLSTTSLQSNDITDTITGVVSSGIANVKWSASFAGDGGCVGTHQLILNVPADAAVGDAVACADLQGLTWLENECSGTRAWQCTGGALHVDAISDTSLDLSFPAVPLAPGGFPGGANLATGTVALDGSCTGVHLAR
jgi:hypothetical protein